MVEPVFVLDVKKRLGNRQVLAGVTLTLEPGTVTHLIAANGAGKTTLLRVIAGVTRADAGAVKNCPRQLAYVPERYKFPSNMSARVYLRHMARIQRVPSNEARATIDGLLNRLQIQPNPTAKLTALSKGNAQKVMIAQAFLAERSLLLLDEPATGLDSEAAETFNTMVEERRLQGCAILRTGHGDATSAYPFRTLHLASGTLSQTTGRPSIVATMRIELLRTSESRDLPLPMSQELVYQQAGSYVLECCAEDTDRYLLEALTRNWSVQSVSPAPGRRA